MTTNNDDGMTCQVICWIAAAVAGIVLFLILSGGLGMGTFLAVILTLLLFCLMGWWLTKTFCTGAAATAQPSAALAPAPTAAAPIATAPAAAPEAAADLSAPEAAPEPATEPEPAPEPAPVPESEPEPAASPVPAAAAAPVASLVRSGTLLGGESELATRKGVWRYEAGPGPDLVPPPAGEDYDGDGVVEGTDEGTRPMALEAARGGKADDLKQIKGVGPKMETMLNEMGFYHYDQIAAWTADEVAWVDANLEGFKGRVSRDDWVGQATILAAGGETEFSRRVEDGDVY